MIVVTMYLYDIRPSYILHIDVNCGKRELFFLLYLLEKILLPRANTTYLLQICIKGGRFSRTLNSHLLKFVQVGINNNVLVFMQLRHFFLSKCHFVFGPISLYVFSIAILNWVFTMHLSKVQTYFSVLFVLNIHT